MKEVKFELNTELYDRAVQWYDTNGWWAGRHIRIEPRLIEVYEEDGSVTITVVPVFIDLRKLAFPDPAGLYVE